jgi:hypothetical protein
MGEEMTVASDEKPAIVSAGAVVSVGYPQRPTNETQSSPRVHQQIADPKADPMEAEVL